MFDRNFRIGDRVKHTYNGPTQVGTVMRLPKEKVFGIVVWDSGETYSFEAGAFLERINPIEELASLNNNV